MKARPKLSYANVVATLALVLALGGGTVYAASKLGKNEVKSKNIAKGAVKGSDIGKNAVTGPKVKDGSLQLADLAKGVISGDVAGTATGGPKTGIDTNTSSPLPLTGTTTFTTKPGEIAAVAAEAQFTLADKTAGAPFCSPGIGLLLNGEPTRIFLSPESVETTTPSTVLGGDASGPYVLIEPGKPLTITAQVSGDDACMADSKVDRIEVRIVKFK
jgi:hypothetical protein